MSRVAEGLYVGSIDDVNTRFLASHNIHRIINLSDFSYIIPGMKIHKFSIPDYGVELPPNSDPIKDMADIITYVSALIHPNDNILIHCNMGQQRAPIVAAGYLMKRGYDKKKAIEQVKKYREEAWPEHMTFRYSLDLV